MELAGQIIGVIAVLFSIASYQMNTSRKLLVVLTCASALFCVHYLLLAKYSGLALNCLAILRNLVYANKEKRFWGAKAWGWIFAAVMLVLGLWTWEGWQTLLITAGLVINTLCLTFSDAQKIRVSLLVTCPMVLVYNVVSYSAGGILNESLALLSAVVGIVRYRRAKKTDSASDTE